jgi:hypothetical protein
MITDDGMQIRRVPAGAGFAAALAAAALCGSAPAAQERPLPAAESFLREVRQHLESNEARQSGYMYVETRRERKLDKTGRSTRESVKVFESYPGLPGEQRWERLVAEDGRPVTTGELAKQDRDREKKAQEYVRKLEKDPEKTRREAQRKRDEYFKDMRESVDEIYRVYDMRLVGREAIEGHDTIVVSLTPRAGARPRTRDGNIMKNFVARAWVSEREFELVKVDVEAIDTVSIGLGILARVHKGTKASFTRRKVNDEVWLPASMQYTASARIALFKVMRVGGASEFASYRKFTVSTTETTRPQN